MWVCAVTFSDGNSHRVHARSLAGLMNRVSAIVTYCSAQPMIAQVVSILMMSVKADRLQQGRAVEYVE